MLADDAHDPAPARACPSARSRYCHRGGLPAGCHVRPRNRFAHGEICSQRRKSGAVLLGAGRGAFP